MLPDPLHPALVHFPIVLLLLGAPLALVAVFVRRWHLPVLAALVLTLGAAGAAVATVTGGKAAEMAGELADNAEKALDEHEEWGERARNAGALAAVLAVLSAALVRKPAAARAAGAVAAIAAIAAALSVAQAGHYGGQAVFKFGIGVNAVAHGASNDPLPPNAGEEKKAGN
ncbi:MAG: DUF2231 domain-containing protein [Verrucomicrobiae bacterium]